MRSRGVNIFTSASTNKKKLNTNEFYLEGEWIYALFKQQPFPIKFYYEKLMYLCISLIDSKKVQFLIVPFSIFKKLDEHFQINLMGKKHKKILLGVVHKLTQHHKRNIAKLLGVSISLRMTQFLKLNLKEIMPK